MEAGAGADQGPENQDSQHLLDQPKGSFPEIRWVLWLSSKGGGVTKGGGGCDPAQLVGTMIVATLFVCPDAAPPPEPTLAVSPELGLVGGILLVLFAT